MRRLTPQQIRETFNAQQEQFKTWGDQTGFNRALTDISHALRDLNDNGVDVSLQIMGTSSEMAFHQLPDRGMTTPISGILQIDHMQYMISLTVKFDGKDCLKLALSEFDIRFNGVNGAITDSTIRNKVRSKVFDLKEDPEALVKFQNEIIRHSARNRVIAAQDVAGTLDTGVKAKKRALKFPGNG